MSEKQQQRQQPQQPQRPVDEETSERYALDDEYRRPNTSERRSGRLLFQSCQSCHVGAPVGPPIWSDKKCILGQTAGTMYGNNYPYSTALKQSGIVWDESLLDSFLENPQAVIPGNFMGNEPMTDPMERKMIIESLKIFCTEDGGKIESTTTSAPSEVDSEEPTGGFGGQSMGGGGPAAGGAMSWTMWGLPMAVTSWLLLGAGGR